jgi:hypothetical protein
MFKNDQEKQDAITHLPTLKDNPGWKFIERALDADVAQLEDQLHERKDFASLEEVYKIQDLRDAAIAFKNLPDKIVAEAKDEPPEQEDNDPY